MFFVSCISGTFAYVHCCLVVTSWERADLLLVMFIVFFVTFPLGIPDQVWYLIVSSPDLCRLSYFSNRRIAGMIINEEISQTAC